MTKESELRAAKRNATLIFGVATVAFVVSLFLPVNFWTAGLKAIAEAAMVGALADWFAVVALFRRIPIPIPGVTRHTAIVPRNQEKIADNLAAFVHEKFLDADSLVALVKRHEPAGILGSWLSNANNASRVSGHIVTLFRGALELTDDRQIQVFMRDAMHVMIDKVDLTQSVATVLDSLTRDGRHQELLDEAIALVVRNLDKPATRDYIARKIVDWIKAEHPVKEKILPTEWIGENLAEQVTRIVNSILDEIVLDKSHRYRAAFDDAAKALIVRLQQDPDMARKADEIKHYLKNDAALNAYVGRLWNDLREWLKADLDAPHSMLRHRLADAGRWLGVAIAGDAALQASLNRHIERAARNLAPDLSIFLTRHIRDTVKGWDAQEMSRQIELNIGKDLQFIRINGTVVGGFIGLILYLLSTLPGSFGF